MNLSNVEQLIINIPFSIFVFALLGLLIITSLNAHTLVTYIKNYFLNKKTVLSDKEYIRIKEELFYRLLGLLLTLLSWFFTSFLFSLLGITFFRDLELLNQTNFIAEVSGYLSVFVLLLFILAGISVEISAGNRWILNLARFLYTITIVGTIFVGIVVFLLK